jgi:hypothetical protein
METGDSKSDEWEQDAMEFPDEVYQCKPVPRPAHGLLIKVGMIDQKANHQILETRSLPRAFRAVDFSQILCFSHRGRLNGLPSTFTSEYLEEE